MAAIITLTTDFGLNDEYVGVMKGVILSRCPDAVLVDLTHNIGKQDLRQAAYVIPAAVPYFPSGTVHVIVVDPWVGTNRRILLVKSGGHFFLAPDNGILTLVLGQDRGAECYEVDCPDLYLKPVSNTFHGRDIFAPVAAALAGGADISALGRPVPAAAVERLDLPGIMVDRQRRSIRGEVVRVDHFGNLVSNIHRQSVAGVAGGEDFSQMVISVCGQRIEGMADSYAAVPPRSLLAIFGSRGYLEIALNQGSAAEQLNAGCGTRIEIAPVGPRLSLYRKKV